MVVRMRGTVGTAFVLLFCHELDRLSGLKADTAASFLSAASVFSTRGPVPSWEFASPPPEERKVMAASPS